MRCSIMGSSIVWDIKVKFYIETSLRFSHTKYGENSHFYDVNCKKRRSKNVKMFSKFKSCMDIYYIEHTTASSEIHFREFL